MRIWSSLKKNFGQLNRELRELEAEAASQEKTIAQLASFNVDDSVQCQALREKLAAQIPVIAQAEATVDKLQAILQARAGAEAEALIEQLAAKGTILPDAAVAYYRKNPGELAAFVKSRPAQPPAPTKKTVMVDLLERLKKGDLTALTTVEKSPELYAQFRADNPIPSFEEN